MAEPMTMAEAHKHYFIIDWDGFLKSESADADGYLIDHNNRKSWLPKEIFERNYHEMTNLTFGAAIEALRLGEAICRSEWENGAFVVKQIPTHISENIIPQMQSLPQIAKDILMARQNPHIDYTNQMLIIHPDGRADSWIPSSSDVFANDWELVTPLKQKEE